MQIIQIRNIITLKFIAISLVFIAITGCSGFELGPPANDDEERGRLNEGGFLFGERGVSLTDLGRATAQTGSGGIGVNAFLWRATLDTLSFLPLASADPFGGVIITDWYSPPEINGEERFKINVLIMDQRLRADAIRVSVFRQKRSGETWIDAEINPNTEIGFENAILTTAREMWLDSDAAP